MNTKTNRSKIELADSKLCCGCGSCSLACKVGACVMRKDNEGFYYPKIDYEKCIGCGVCSRSCPILNQEKLLTKQFITESYCGYYKDNQKLKKCASGGAASALAEAVLSTNGVVYGAAFSENFKSVRHVRVSDLTQLESIRGTKYTQSDMSDIYETLKKDVLSGRNVLFTGTPCQVGAVKSFLQKDYDNLMTCQLICQGVMSNTVQEKFVDELECKYKSLIVSFSVRYKKETWIPPYVHAEFEDGRIYEEFAQFTDYGEAHELFFRPSCFHCMYKGERRCADITIGDCWGLNHSAKEWNDLGISIIIIHSDKGRDIINSMRGFEKYPINFIDYLNANPMIIKSWSESIDRKKFAEILNESSLKSACKSVRKPKQEVKRFLIKVLPKKLYLRMKGFK